MQEAIGSLGTLGQKQFFGLVDGDDQGWWALVGLARQWGNPLCVAEFAQGVGQRLGIIGFAFEHLAAQGGAVDRQAGGAAGLIEGGDQAVVAGQCVVDRADDRQHREVAIVAGQARQQAGAHERGLAGPRGAENDQQPGWRVVAQAAQFGQQLDDGRFAAEEDAGVFGFKRAHAAVGRPVRVVGWWPLEKARVETGAHQAGAQAF